MKLSKNNGVSGKMQRFSFKRMVSDRKFWVRLMAGFLVLLMLLSAAAALLPFFGMNSYAAGAGTGNAPAYYYTADGSDILVAVGLMYADGVTVGFETKAPFGFEVGILNSARTFEKIFEIEQLCVSVVCDANLGKKGMSYYIASSGDMAIGGWHVEVAVSKEQLDEQYQFYRNSLIPADIDIFRAVANGEYKIRIGQFSSQGDAERYRDALAAQGIQTAVVSPSSAGVAVVDPYTDKILFEYSAADGSALGMAALQKDPANVAYLKTPAQNTYSGIFKYARWKTNTVDGVALTNVLPLEDYIKGVIPWEIGANWPLETQKTFAVAARSFALVSRKHVTFDVCNGPCCQMYKGLNKTNATILQAVAETAGTVLCYNGRIASVYYSSSTGGTTVSAAEAWGGTQYGYLQGVVTPWERYQNYSNGSWKKEYSPTELLNRLNANGYPNLSGAIASVKINSFAKNSSYVYSVTLTDVAGKSVTINRTDAIRTVLGLNSANFVVAKAGETVAITDYALSYEGLEEVIAQQQAEENAAQEQETASQPQQEENSVFYVVTGAATGQPVALDSKAQEVLVLDGQLVNPIKVPQTLYVINAQKLSLISGNAATAVNDSENTWSGIENTDSGEDGYVPGTSTSVGGNGAALPDIVKASANVVTTQRTVVAQGTGGNFVFIGRGWGHGVGLSQYGVLDLAKLGYSYQDILSVYLPGTSIVSYKTMLTQ